MQNALRFKKIEMSQVFDIDGNVKPITVLGADKSFQENLQKDDVVTTIGKSKGKGFAGGVKRWGFAGGPRTHGQSDRERRPGSIGAGTDPGRIWKGQHMAGRMGQKRVTVKGLRILEVDNEKNTIKVSGSVPGARNSEVWVRKI